MRGVHVVSGGALGAILAALLARYAVSLPPDVTALIGSLAATAGAGAVHVLADVGIVPAIRRVIFGPPKPS